MTPPASAAPGPLPQPAASSRASVFVIGLLLALLLGVDWGLPLRGPLSYALALTLSVLFLPWAVLTLRFKSARAEDQHGPRRAARLGERRLWGFVLRAALLLLVVSFLVAKWAVLLAAGARDASFVGASRSYTLGLALMMTLGLATRDLRAARFLATASLHPARLMALSFGGVGIAGALLLSLPISIKSMSSASLVDSLFMAFSAVCVTGLATVNIAETYSFPGQLVLLSLVQAGGLGIMVLSAAVAIMAGQRLRLKSSAMLTEVVDGASLSTLRRNVLTICGLTVLCEALGALAFYWRWVDQEAIALSSGHPLAGAGSVWWAAIFHAISAFCNAGMSNFEAGMTPFAGDPLTLGSMSLLVVIGGLGFPVLDELLRKALSKLRRKRAAPLSLHARIVLRASGALLVVMTVGYVALEWQASFGALPYDERVFAGVFQSVVARTAGFNVVDVGAMLPATLLLTCVAMFIGGGSGSTAGGIKVTTLVALLAGLRAELGARAAHVLNRTLPDTVIRKAMGVSFLSLSIVLLAWFALLLFETHAPLSLAFEAVSAFGTVGLSTGVTPELSVPGKLLIIVLMFAGRIGPLTLALALASKAQQREVELPQEKVLIG